MALAAGELHGKPETDKERRKREKEEDKKRRKEAEEKKKLEDEERKRAEKEKKKKGKGDIPTSEDRTDKLVSCLVLSLFFFRFSFKIYIQI